MVDPDKSEFPAEIHSEAARANAQAAFSFSGEVRPQDEGPLETTN